jgi:hypothetical protein
VELLELLEGADHVLALGEGLGLLAELGLGLEVLAEIQVAEFAVDLHQVVELLHVELVGVIDIAEILLRDRTGLAPAVLDLAEFREGVLHVALLLDEGLEVLDDGLLLGEVVLALCVELAIVLGALFLISIVKGLEAGLDGGERAHGLARRGLGGHFFHSFGIGFFDRRILAGFRLFAGEPLIEGGLQGLSLLGTLHTVFAFRQFLKQSRQFSQGLLAIVDDGFLDFLGSLLHFFLGLLHNLLHFFHGLLGRFLCYICGLDDGLEDLRLHFFTHSKMVFKS